MSLKQAIIEAIERELADGIEVIEEGGGYAKYPPCCPTTLATNLADAILSALPKGGMERLTPDEIIIAVHDCCGAQSLEDEAFVAQAQLDKDRLAAAAERARLEQAVEKMECPISFGLCNGFDAECQSCIEQRAWIGAFKEVLQQGDTKGE